MATNTPNGKNTTDTDESYTTDTPAVPDVLPTAADLGLTGGDARIYDTLREHERAKAMRFAGAALGRYPGTDEPDIIEVELLQGKDVLKLTWTDDDGDDDSHPWEGETVPGAPQMFNCTGVVRR